MTAAPTAVTDGALHMAGYWPRAFGVVLMITAVVAVRIHEFFPGIGVIKPVVTLSFGGIALLAMRSRNVLGRLGDQTLSKLVFLYFGMVIITMPFALWKGGAVEVMESLLPAILMYAAFSFVPPTRYALDRLQFGIVVLVLFFAWYVQFFGSSWGGRLISVSGSYDANDIASLLALTLPLSIGVMTRSSAGRERWGAVLAVLALMLGVIATGSRGGFLALIAGAIVYVGGLKGTRRIGVLSVMTVVGALFWLTAPETFRGRVTSLTNLEADYNTTQEAGRKAVWRRARGYIRANPITGVGAGSFIVAEGGYNATVGRTGKWSASHNAYLQALAELGIPGGGVYILMLLVGAWIGVRLCITDRSARGPPGPDPLYRPEFLAALCAFATGAIFLSHAYYTPQFAVLGLIALAERVMIAERAGVGIVRPGHGASPPVQQPRGERGGLVLGNPVWSGRGAARSMIRPLPVRYQGTRGAGG